MAREVWYFAAKIPAGTPQSAPITIDCSFPTRVVTSVQWDVPPGPNGLMGFQVANAGVPIIPQPPGTWIVSNDHHHEWELHDQITSGSWQVIGYNTGIYDHTVYVHFLVELPADPASTPPTTLIAASSLTAPADPSLLPAPDLIAGA